MPILIGIDTGGTYTDAVVFEEESGILGKAKALTTRHDLSDGIAAAMDSALRAAGVEPQAIAMLSLSTTLATNAIVEGVGDKVGLILVGFDETDFGRAGLREALGTDAVLFLQGGHTAHGAEQAPLDLAPLTAWLDLAGSGASAFAVGARFSTANPTHEIAVRDDVHARTGKPVTCGHELSANLNAPKRALTSLLNARLIGTIHHLIDATESLLAARGMRAQVMVVKGDGSLISAAEARRRPIETILSGPAASLVGASYLTGLQDALVSDIGGTTTDVAFLTNGRPRLNPQGARVGGWSTMVQAVAMHTTGLGGDSDVALESDPSGPLLRLGPRRVLPVSLLASQFGQTIHAHLDQLLALDFPPDSAGRFAMRAARPGHGPAPESDVEAEILAAIASQPVGLSDLLTSRRHHSAMNKLVARGAAQIAAFCPSDAAHVLHLHDAWDREAAVRAATLFARRRGKRGEAIAADAEAISRTVIDTLVHRSAETLVDAAFFEDGDDSVRPSTHPLVQAAISGRSRLVSLSLRISVPVVALGASARTYYPAVAARLDTELVAPDHADVANAVGAVVGHVRISSTAQISRPSDGLFRTHLEAGPRDFTQIEEAKTYVEQALRADVARKAEANGVVTFDTTVSHEENTVALSGETMFLESRVTATAVGRPALA